MSDHHPGIARHRGVRSAEHVDGNAIYSGERGRLDNGHRGIAVGIADDDLILRPGRQEERRRTVENAIANTGIAERLLIAAA